jgi:hypothetical protein
MQQGTVDGQENPIANIYNNKYYEVQKYLTMSNHFLCRLPSDRFRGPLEQTYPRTAENFQRRSH